MTWQGTLTLQTLVGGGGGGEGSSWGFTTIKDVTAYRPNHEGPWNEHVLKLQRKKKQLNTHCVSDHCWYLSANTIIYIYQIQHPEVSNFMQYVLCSSCSKAVVFPPIKFVHSLLISLLTYYGPSTFPWMTRQKASCKQHSKHLVFS